MQVAVLGSHREDLDPGLYEAAQGVGRAVAQRGHVLITGASTGISAHAAIGAAAAGGLVIGISPAAAKAESGAYTVTERGLAAVVYTGMGYKGRNVITVRSADCIVVLHGGFGTLNEVAIAEGDGKPIVALTPTGGCAAQLPSIFAALNPRYQRFYGVQTLAELEGWLDAFSPSLASPAQRAHPRDAEPLP